ncbi:Gfo/Idh/MocA family protein [Sphingobacterium suaedae]|uniref:Gfo/Idh/MocA family protein n=1 Tax=Sphingobacterium suaedae TaxID=1686402 RepID=A0ABW5KM15_9SPHI
MMKPILLSITLSLLFFVLRAQSPLKLAIAGLSHGHVDWVFNRDEKKDIEVVGIYETNPELINRYALRYQIARSLFFSDLGRMLDQVKPDAVSAFGAISEHIDVIRICAPKKVHVMVEKPLATTFSEAQEMQRLAEEHGIHVLTNFETSWYQSNQEIKTLLEGDELGDIRKVMVNDGHQGPREIGVSDEFLEILTDPQKNGAGALVDFGCYGGNLMTWLMEGKRPISVTAIVHQNKPQIYPKVDDEATIILQYPKAQCVIQASWNWPVSRKDMEVYGTHGYAIATDAKTLRYRLDNQREEQIRKTNARQVPFDDPFSVLAAVIKGTVVLDELDQYALPINVITVEILDAAIRSARQKKTIYLNK